MTAGDFDKFKWDHELKRRDAERAHDQESEHAHQLNDAAISSGQHALRGMMLINGGAVVTMLAFVGTLVGKDNPNIARAAGVAPILLHFALGVALAATAMALGYLVNFCWGAASDTRIRDWNHPWIKPGPKTWRWEFAAQTFQFAAVLAGLASLTMFVCGAFEVRQFIETLS